MDYRIVETTWTVPIWRESSGDRVMEQRWGTRVAADIGVRLISGSATQKNGAGRLVNFSVSGGFVRTSLALPLLAIVNIAPLMRECAGGWPFRLRGCVVRGMRSGLGIEWCEVLSTAELQRLCDVLCLDPALTDKRDGRPHA